MVPDGLPALRGYARHPPPYNHLFQQINNPSMPNYFFKRVSYHYDDETFSPSYGEINYQSISGDKQAAEKRLLQLERREYQTAYGMEEFDQVLRRNTSAEEQEQYLAALNAFSMEQFGFKFMEKRWEPIGNTPWRMPATATLEQAKAFRELSGIRFYELVESDTEVPSLVGVYLTGKWTKAEGWLTYQGVKHSEERSDSGIPERETKIVPYAFAGESAVLRAQKQGLLGLSHGDYAVQLIGKPGEISEQPTLLRALVESDQQLSFHPETGNIVPAQYAHNPNWMAVNELLTNKIFDLRILPEDLVVAGNGFGIDMY
jgi:hypothetical protein